MGVGKRLCRGTERLDLGEKGNREKGEEEKAMSNGQDLHFFLYTFPLFPCFPLPLYAVKSDPKLIINRGKVRASV